MNNSTDFQNATPRMKAAMVLDAYSHLSAQFSKLAQEQKVLNQWISQLPDLIERGKCDVIDVPMMGKLLANVGDMHDELTEQFMKHHECINKLTNYLTKKQFV